MRGQIQVQNKHYGDDRHNEGNDLQIILSLGIYRSGNRSHHILFNHVSASNCRHQIIHGNWKDDKLQSD